jgi:uncharacterized membrane protein HdeD (DUF308 family)
MEKQQNRPLGVTIIAILMIIVGILSIAGGAILFLLGGFVLVAVGIASIVVAYGLWKAKRWAWTITLILSAIGVISGITYLALGKFQGIGNVIINGVIIYYLFRPNVKAFFGKMQPSAIK